MRARTQVEQSQAYRQQAIRILEQLAREKPDAPDYRFLLALCYRPPVTGPAALLSPRSPMEHRPAAQARDPSLARRASVPLRAQDSIAPPADAEGRRRALRLLEELTARYPEVADYRYELTTTYAWMHVGLYPWQRPAVVGAEAERHLCKALDESRWLVTHHPTLPDYARARALILAKLGTVCWTSRRHVEAERFFQEAAQVQDRLIAEFPDLPSHNRVLAEFLRCRQTQLAHERYVQQHDPQALATAGDLLRTCADRLTVLRQRRELAKDRLAGTTLPLAYETLSRVLADQGERDQADEARRHARIAASPPADRLPPSAL